MVFEITECAQAERAGRQGLDFERTISDIASRFIGIYDLDEAINASLADIGRLSGASRACLFLFSEDGTLMEHTHEWCAEGVRSAMDSCRNLPCAMFPWLMPRLSEGQAIRIQDASRLPAEAEAEREVLKDQGIKSAVKVPLATQGKPLGFLGLADVLQVERWRDEDVALLCVVSHILGRAFDRRAMDDAIRRSEEKYRAIFENTGTAMIVVEEDTTISLANAEFERISGYSREEIEGKKSWTELFSKDDLGKMKEYHRLRRIDPTAAPRSYECVFVDREGHARDIFITVSMVPRTRQSTGSLVEITERKRAVKALRNARHLFERTLMSLADAVFIIDAETVTIRECNPAAERMFGYGREELVGREVGFLHVDQIYLEEFRWHLRRAMKENGSLQHFEFKMKRKDGTIFPTEHSVTSIVDEQDRRTAWVSVVSDISDRKRAEQEKEVMQAQFLQAQKMEAIGTLAGGVAHDFNNLLTGIQGYAELAMTKVDEADPLYRDLKQIHRSSLRAAGLARQLLLFSRKQPMELVPLNMNRVVESLLKMLHRLIGEDIEIGTDLDPDLWTVRADKGNIEQVIMNLVVNARDAMPGGGKLTIQTRNVMLDEGACRSSTCPGVPAGRYVSLSVADTGSGMDAALLDRIFDPFFTTKSSGEGTGLGLSTAYGIVRQHGGCIAVQSTPGQGSRFDVCLPAVSLTPLQEETEMAASLSELRGKGERVLVVEDEKAVCEFVTAVLGGNGYTVFDARNAKEALSLFERENGNFDLLLADVVLPGLSGIDLADQLLSQKPDLPVLLTSGYMDDKSQAPLIRQRGFHFIQKPYALVDLLRVARRALGND